MNNFTKNVLFILTLGLITAKAIAQPIMTLPTVTTTTITNTGATLGGTIGGAGITFRGTSWKISSPVIATDNQLAEGGTTAGLYSHSRSGMPAATQIFFVAYGTNAGGTAISAESSFYTLSNPPSGQPGSFSATTASSIQINLTWGAVTSNGFLIYRKNGAVAPVVTVDVVNGANPPATLTDGSTLITTTAGGSTSYSNNSGLSSGTQYSYTIVPFGYNGSNTQTYNYLTASAKTATATTFAANSDIVLIAGTTTALIDYSSFQTASGLTTGVGANSVSLGRFSIRDGGGANDGDGTGTTLTSVTLTLSNSANVRTVAIFDALGNNLGEQPGAPTLVFSSLSITASQNSVEFFRIRATFNTVVTDQQIINLTITNANASGSGSGFAASNAGGANTSATGENVIQVTANQLAFNPPTLPNAAPVANFGPLKVAAVDDNGNIQISRTNVVTLSLQSGTGALNPGAQSLTPNLVSGAFTWTNISINQAGVKNLRATYTGLTRADVLITISSLGALVTAGTVPSMCYSGDYQTISAITIAERDPADFATGAARTFSLVLPTGFLFNNAITTAPAISGADISAMSILSYTPDKTTVFFSYTIGGTAALDQIVINGLQVNYAGTTAVAGANLVRFGGTAVQVGNASSDAQNYCTLTSANSATVTSFNVATAPGQPSVNPTDTRFQIGINTVKLVGTPNVANAGVFSGPGVSYNATLSSYVFSPSSLGVSTGNVIVYDYPESTGQHCHVRTTQNFDVYASVIQNLQLNYCTNATTSPTLNVLQVDVDSQFSPANSYAYYDLVYLYSFNYSQTITVGPIVFGPTTNTNDIYTYTYNYIGTTTPATVVTTTYTYNSYFGFFGYTSVPTVNTTSGSVNTFNPAQAYYKNYYSGGVFVYYRARKSTSPFDIQLGAYQFVTLTPPPTVTFNMAKTTFCDYDAAVTLTGSPLPNNGSDDFTGAVGIGTSITSPSINNWLFTPANIGTKSASIAITYGFTDPITSCSNTAQQSVTVNPKPSSVPLSNIQVSGSPSTNLYVCKNGVWGSFDGTPIVGTTYKWYSDIALVTSAGLPGNKFFPSLTTNVALPPVTTPFYVTRSLLGCESLGTLINATVTTPVTISTVASPAAICQGSQFDLTTLGVTITGGTTTGTWSSIGGGIFTDNLGNPSGTFGPSTTKYDPSNAEKIALTAPIKLTSNIPGGTNPCPAVQQNFTIPISQALSINPIANITACPGQSPIPIQISTVLNGSGITTATWSSALAQGKFKDRNSSLPVNNPLVITTAPGANVDVEYMPSVSELNSGSNIVLNDVKVMSNSAGSCAAVSTTISVTLNAAPKVAVGADQVICSDQAVTLIGSFSGAATQANWATAGIGTFSTYSNTTNPVSTTYTLNSAELNYSSDQVLNFTLTTNDPDGTGPCIAATQLVPLKVTVHPIPLRPVINPFTYPNNQPAFCVNNLLTGSTVTATLASVNSIPNTLNWYTNANAAGLPLVSGPLNLASFVNSANAGITSFWATQKTTYGCEGKKQLLANVADPVKFDVVVNPNPSLRFIVYGLNSLTGLCLNDQTTFDATASTIGQAPSPGSIASYQWDFADPTPPTAELTSPITTHTYKNLGTYNVSLKGTSDKGCTSTITASSLSSPSIAPNLPNNSVLVIGSYPITDFSVKDQCLTDLTKFKAIDTSSPAATIAQWDWTFGNGTSQSVKDPNLIYAASGIYNVNLTQTSNLGCVNSISKKAYVLPQVKFTSANQFTYAEGFENNNNATNNGGWAPEVYIVKNNSSTTSSWNLPTAYGTTLTGAASGSKAWVAGLTGVTKTYNTNETSVLNAPCFDISSLDKPVISFDYFEDTWKRNDGVYVQYSTDNGVSWSRLGTKGKGIEWYDNSFITGLSGSGSLGQAVGQEGWDGQSGGWKTARYSLNGIGNTFRLRFFFGAQGSTDQSVISAYNGFGLDNIFIQNSNRTVLAESFSNSAASGSATFNSNFSNFKNGISALALVKIQYRTSIGGADAESELNPADPMARAAFYGVTNAQNGLKGFIDGSDGSDLKLEPVNQRFNGNIVPNGAADNYFASRALVPSPLNIALTPGVAGDSLTVSADLTTLAIPITLVGHQYVVQMAIVELKGGQYLLRKLLPNAAGKPLTALAANATQNIKYSWKVSAPINPGNLSAICFVQDLITQDILQATSATFSTAPPLVTGVEPTSAAGLNFYPIPADKGLIVMLSEEAVVTTPLIIYDAVGKSIHQSSIEKGQRSTTVDTKGFSEGIYIIQLETDKGTVRRKVMVVHP